MTTPVKFDAEIENELNYMRALDLDIEDILDIIRLHKMQYCGQDNFCSTCGTLTQLSDKKEAVK